MNKSASDIYVATIGLGSSPAGLCRCLVVIDRVLVTAITVADRQQREI
jgi:hypothetical protein